jgi:hypothetical protein
MPATALITGASSGIGAAFARKLAARKYDLILVARRQDRLQALARELEGAHSVSVETLAADLARDEDLDRVQERIAGTPALEFLVNNAGFGSRGFFHEADLEGQDRMHRVHIMATMRLSHAALKLMVPRGRGNIVNLSSVAAFVQGTGNISYCATKAWINSFTYGLYKELREARSPVRVQALCPGFTYTEFHDVMKADRTQIPQGWWMPVDPVVDASLRALERDKLFVVPGARYRFLVFLLEWLPRPLIRKLPGHLRKR